MQNSGASHAGAGAVGGGAPGSAGGIISQGTRVGRAVGDHRPPVLATGLDRRSMDEMVRR